MNKIMILKVRKENSHWVFDDETKGLVSEPFVSGSGEIIDFLSGGADEVVITFSKNGFPGANKLSFVKKEYDGAWYELEENGMQGWLCEATLLYFKKFPKNIYVKVS